MPRARTLIALLFTAALVSAFLGTAAWADAGGLPNDNADFGRNQRDVCARNGKANQAHCDSRVVTQRGGATLAATTSYRIGYTPADLQSAYNLPSATAGNGQTIAIIDAYDNPNAYSDLKAYRSQFNLPACLAASDGGTCFRKVNQNGQESPLPTPNRAWGHEIAIDLDMASAVCPNCNLILVEANSSSFDDLIVAVDTAAAMGANEISNSYGSREFSDEQTYESHYNHPGIAITVSTGDHGYRVEFPASSQYVTAVGGTTLTRSSSTSSGWNETAWRGAGSGCSKYIPKPSWQSTISTCSNRAVADVSAVANPSTGVAVYDSYGSTSTGNWLRFGGTSVAAPIVAGVYALAGGSVDLSYTYGHPGSLNDIIPGTNGRCRTTPNLCMAGPGWDGPTGMGTPNGVGAF